MARVFDPVQLGSIELFCKAAELGGFTAAAEALGVTPASVSRSIARLENRLGVRLFVRTTRQVRLTSDGEVYRSECQQALDQIADAERVITGHQRTLAGQLRISVGTVYAHYRLVPLLPAFTARHPGIEIELDVANRNVDFVEEGYDLAVRLGEPPDSGLVARKLEDAGVGIYAAPGYLARHGTPQSLEALHDHRLIQFLRPSTGRPLPWLFRNDAGEDIEWTFRSRQRVLDDVLAAVGWALAGGGLCQIYHFVVQESVQAGRLVEVLPAYGGRSRPFHVLYPRNRHLSARVRAFVDHLASSIATA